MNGWIQSLKIIPHLEIYENTYTFLFVHEIVLRENIVGYSILEIPKNGQDFIHYDRWLNEQELFDKIQSNKFIKQNEINQGITKEGTSK